MALGVMLMIGLRRVEGIALPNLGDTLGYLLPDSASLSVGTANGPVIVRHGKANGPLTISLRPMVLTDPPLLVSLPFLLGDMLK